MRKIAETSVCNQTTKSFITKHPINELIIHDETTRPSRVIGLVASSCIAAASFFPSFDYMQCISRTKIPFKGFYRLANIYRGRSSLLPPP